MTKIDKIEEIYKNGWTPLHESAYKGYKEVVVFLVAQGADVNAQDKSRETPLHWAVFRGHKEVVEFLVKKGANVNAQDKEGFTPLHWAKWAVAVTETTDEEEKKRLKEVIAYLKSKGATL